MGVRKVQLEEESSGNREMVSIQSSGSGIKMRNTLKKDSHCKVCEELFLRYETMSGKGVPVSGPLLQEEALQFKNVIRK